MAEYSVNDPPVRSQRDRAAELAARMYLVGDPRCRNAAGTMSAAAVLRLAIDFGLDAIEAELRDLEARAKP